MNSPWPAALMFAVPIALGVLYLFARFPILDKLIDRLKCWHWRNDQTGYDMKRGLEGALRRGWLERDALMVRDRYPSNGESQL